MNEGVHDASFYHLIYASSSHPGDLSENFLRNNAPSHHLSIHGIINAKYTEIHRCKNGANCHSNENGIGAQRCQYIHDGFQPDECFEKLALLVPPSWTHKHIKSDNGITKGMAELIKVHPYLCSPGIDGLALPRLSISAVITSEQDSSLPADIILLELDNLLSGESSAAKSKQTARDILLHWSSLLNHEAASDAPWSVLKAFPIHSISIHYTNIAQSISAINNFEAERTSDYTAVPCCPVCLHRIEPAPLGLPDLKREHKCSRWCSTFTTQAHGSNGSTCVNEMKLEPWPPPANCRACHVISQRDSTLEIVKSASSTQNNTLRSGYLQCTKCNMNTTLWVCLTCGAVGCGRYTLKHAADHFTTTGHPYSLELATMRIWDYENGAFVHRRDLLECPVMSMKWDIGTNIADSMQFASPLLASPATQNESLSISPRQQYSKNDEALSPNQNGHSTIQLPQSSCQSNPLQNLAPDKLSHPPKKSMMVSEEYEALLQSALEDQAMHFEGEISHLRAELASARMNQYECITEKDAHEIYALRKDSDKLQCELESLSSAILEVQAEECKSRALSQKLLREQSISKELLEKLRHDTRWERDTCRQRMDDLELQIEDLTANLRVRTQIAQSEELDQAQIFGTIGGSDEGSNSKKKGKKSLRFGRKK